MLLNDVCLQKRKFKVLKLKKNGVDVKFSSDKSSFCRNSQKSFDFTINSHSSQVYCSFFICICVYKKYILNSLGFTVFTIFTVARCSLPHRHVLIKTWHWMGKPIEFPFIPDFTNTFSFLAWFATRLFVKTSLSISSHTHTHRSTWGKSTLSIDAIFNLSHMPQFLWVCVRVCVSVNYKYTVLLWEPISLLRSKQKQLKRNMLLA